ncbi:MAG: oxamate carbamoyltransferase subunit AllG family protein [Pseudonocardia sp.]
MRPLVLPDEVSVVNVGLPMFADAVRAQDRPVQHVEWRIPAGGDLDAVAALTTLHGDAAAGIDAANAEVVRRLDAGIPQLTGVSTVGTAVPGVEGRMLLHCGPPLPYVAHCDPLRRSLRAATIAEGWAADVAEADRLLDSGEITLDAANHHDTVVPMASAIGPSAPVLVVDERESGLRAFAPLNQGPGEVAWFGRETDAAVARLRFLSSTAGPAVAAILGRTGPLDVLAIAAQGITMGDDLHMRTQAATNLLVRTWLPHVAALPDAVREPFAAYLGGNHLFFLNLAMAAAKSLQRWAEQVAGSSIVTTMARNGTTFGIKLGTSDWYLTDAPPVGDALYNAGQGPETAAPDIGDSAVLELTGLGGPAAGNSPAVASFLGGSMADAAAATEGFRAICAGTSSRFTLPAMGFTGTPLGVDARLVVELGITPKVTTGILHASDGSGQVGAGVATAPLECFVAAVRDLASRVSVH